VFAQKNETKPTQPATSTAKPTEQTKTNETKTETPPKSAEPFDGTSVEKMSKQCVTLETELGNIEIEVFAKDAPETARNFLNLASIGAFDTMTFSRVVKDFVIQSGNGRSRETITPELIQRLRRVIPDEPNSIKHVRGIVSIARPEENNKATCQFFILVSEAEHLDGKFSAFGRGVKGMEIVDQINKAETDSEKPVTPVRIKRAVVKECK
jgi:peptidyl-prolyl cis-trans isomerase B (cyclophilin B)